MSGLNIGLVGATGLVGKTFIHLLKSRQFPVKNLKPFASSSSEGQFIHYQDRSYPIKTLEEGCFKDIDLVFFSSGDSISRKWAPRAVKEGAFVIDNSAAHRMNPEILLCVPEVNGNKLPKKNDSRTIIANPNCSTIQLTVALNPLLKTHGLSSIRVASYQSVSGMGREGLAQLIKQSQAILDEKEPPTTQVFNRQMAFTAIPQIGSVDTDGFCSEEIKIVTETRRILSQPKLSISALTVRIPTLNGHSQALWFCLKEETCKEELIALFRRSAGLELWPTTSHQTTKEDQGLDYPVNTGIDGSDFVHIGKLRKDPIHSKGWQMWVVADNLRKGAALNSIQIAERIFDITQESM